MELSDLHKQRSVLSLKHSAVIRDSSGKPHSVTVGKYQSFKCRLSLPVETFGVVRQLLSTWKALIHSCLCDCKKAQTRTSLCATGVNHTQISAGEEHKLSLRLQSRSSKWCTVPLLKAILKSLVNPWHTNVIVCSPYNYRIKDLKQWNPSLSHPALNTWKRNRVKCALAI